jgi:transcriptional regulator with XRE-family HTH domain
MSSPRSSLLRQPLPALVNVDGEAVRAHRERLGLTRTSLAAACFSSTSYLANVEDGRRPRMTAARFAALVDALGGAPEHLTAV